MTLVRSVELFGLLEICFQNGTAEVGFSKFKKHFKALDAGIVFYEALIGNTQ